MTDVVRRQRPFGMLRELAFARSLEDCRECSKLGTQGIVDAIERAIEGFCSAIARMGPGEKEHDDVLVEFTAAAIEAGLCSDHAAGHARIAMSGIPTAE